MIISLSAKGQFGLFHCTATWSSTEGMRLSDTPRTKENSAGELELQLPSSLWSDTCDSASAVLLSTEQPSPILLLEYSHVYPAPFLSSMPSLSDSAVSKIIRPSLCTSHTFPFPSCVFIPRTLGRTQCFSRTRDFRAIPAPLLICSTSLKNKEQECQRRGLEYTFV